MAGSPEEGLRESAPDAKPVSPPAAAGARIDGLDAARAVAIVGMVMVHFGPNSPSPENWLALFYGVPHGRASLLFVLLAGISMTLLVGAGDRQKWARAWPRLVVRVAVLLPLGLGLQLMDIRVFVILHFYALFFVLAIPATLLRDRFLLLSAGMVGVGGPVLYLLVQRVRPDWFWSDDYVALGEPPGVILRDLFFTGSYPAIVWMAPFLFGMWLGRQRLHGLRFRLVLLVGGGAAIVLAHWLQPLSSGGGWWELATTEAHSQSILWLVQGTGCAAVALALCLISTELLRRAMWPPVAMGQLALTIYIAHLILLAAAPSTFTNWDVEPALTTVASVILGAGLFAVIWRRRFPRGPIEGLIHGLARGPALLQARLRRTPS